MPGSEAGIGILLPGGAGPGGIPGPAYLLAR
jgi:hypothetical protein